MIEISCVICNLIANCFRLLQSCWGFPTKLLFTDTVHRYCSNFTIHARAMCGLKLPAHLTGKLVRPVYSFLEASRVFSRLVQCFKASKQLRKPYQTSHS